MAEHVVAFIEQYGYAAIFVLMLAENVFPPLPSELIMPFAGFAAADGSLSLPLVVAAGTAGSIVGTLPWYLAGRWIGDERLKHWAARHGRWITMSPHDIERADRWFDQHGHWAVMLGRLVPALRSVISAPAGVSGMAWPSYLAWSTVGTLAWTGGLAALGHALRAGYGAVAAYVDPVSMAVLAGAVLLYAWRVLRFDPER